MLYTNPFSVLAEVVSPLAMQGFIIAMIVLIALALTQKIYALPIHQVLIFAVNILNVLLIPRMFFIKAADMRCINAIACLNGSLVL